MSTIPFKIPGSQSDRQLLHYYCCQASWNLSTYSNTTLWTELILQRSYHEPVVRNALIALSSLHRDYLCGDLVVSDHHLNSHGSPRIAPPVKTMSIIGKCHRQLRTYLSRDDASPEIALICSLIFYTFESLLGDSQKAIWHLDRGLTLLKQSQTDRKFEVGDDGSSTMMESLTTMFNNLDIQASAFDDRRDLMVNLVSDSEVQGKVDLVPDEFQDVAHAERILTKLQNWTLHHVITHVQHKGRSSDEMPLEVLRERIVLGLQFERYATALADLVASKEVGEDIVMSSSSSKADDIQSKTETLLLCKVHFHCYRYLLRENLPVALPAEDTVSFSQSQPSPSPSPSSPSSLPDMTSSEDLDMALESFKSLLSVSTASSTTGQGPGSRSSDGPGERIYTLSTHLIGTLYFLSLKATNPKTLSMALDLFSHPRIRDTRDGLWDSHTAWFVVRNLLKLRDNGGAAAKTKAKNVAFVQPRESTDREVLRDMMKFQDMSAAKRVPMMQSRTVTVGLKDHNPNPNNDTLLLLPPYFPVVATATDRTSNNTTSTNSNSTSSHQSTTTTTTPTPPPTSTSFQSSTTISPLTDNNDKNDKNSLLVLDTFRQTWPPVSNCPSRPQTVRSSLGHSTSTAISFHTPSPFSTCHDDDHDRPFLPNDTIPRRHPNVQSRSEYDNEYVYGPPQPTSHAARLENVGFGIIDAEGGLNEAARKVWSRVRELDLSLTI
ncbi:hypothetical protein H2204_013843 [Knufia peltigerae]|uniref:Uncharacterized protein n=1 Tax=Knufia peltigerae TaxID=1002370 RepID=A0AA38XPT7_9EURO|nr:hypothetical protein H2204_013843 [Knufia peltigerae]